MIRKLLMTTAFVAAFAAPSYAEDFTKEQIETMIHAYIMDNPQVLIDSVNAYDLKQRSAQDEKSIEALKANADWLYKNKKHAEAGNPKGDVTLVEFFDYNCGYCKQAVGDVMTLLDEDKNLRVVFIEIPILSESSHEASRWALAANKQDRYLEFHTALMRHKGNYTPDVLADLATKAGLDVEKLKADITAVKAQETIADNLNMASTLGITGTPAFILGDDIIRGYVGVEGMRKAVSVARAKAKKNN